MGEMVQITDVFRSSGQPQITYVEREKRKYENDLSAILKMKGKICLLTGPSKTGKTTLYRKVLSENNLEPIIISCNFSISVDQFWRKALEQLNFDRINCIQKSSERDYSISGDASGELGWSWLAKMSAKFSPGLSIKNSEIEIRETILSEPAPEHLIPILKLPNFILIVEEFHYLNPEVKKTIFQQWKPFVDNDVSVIIIGTSHHAVDLAFANKDLIGRIIHMEMPIWNLEDLKQILIQGFNYLHLILNRGVADIISSESAGLPIITQQVGLQLFLQKNIDSIRIGEKIAAFEKTNAYKALYRVATTEYSQYQTIYDRLRAGPRKKRRKYNTYEILLSAFSMDPIKISLSRLELNNRIESMGIQKTAIPPKSSINSTLDALEKFQHHLGITILEWNKNNQCLYILEPSFLFYLRCREERTAPLTGAEILEGILKKMMSQLNDIL